MEERPKYVDVVVKLNRLTKEGKLSWQEVTLLPPPTTPRYFRYRTLYKDKYFVLSAPPSFLDAMITGGKILDLVRSPTLTIEDDAGKMIFSFPQTSLINDLLNSIRYKMDEAGTFLDDFLKEEL